MPRIYPSFQDTNTNAKGSLIFTIDNDTEYIDIFVNNNLKKRQYPNVEGIYSVPVNYNDIVRLERYTPFRLDFNRIDYTTDDNNDYGIINGDFTVIPSTTAYTFTATTIDIDYNFEYNCIIREPGYAAKILFTYNTSVIQNLNTALFTQKYFWIQGFQSSIQKYLLGANPITFSGTTNTTQDLGYITLDNFTGNTYIGAITTEVCYTGLTSGLPIMGIPTNYFKIYVNGNLQSTTSYTSISNGFGIVRACDYTGATSQTFVTGSFTCNDLDTIEYVFDNNFTIQNNTPTPTPTPTVTLTSTPTITSTPTPTPTITPTPLPGSGITSAYQIYVNQSTASYPNSGTIWTSLATGTTYNGVLTNGPVWNNGSPAYFQFDGTNDYVNFTGSTGFDTANFTYGGWVNIPTGNTEQTIFLKGYDGAGAGWSMSIYKTTNNKFATSVITLAPSQTQSTAIGTTTISNNTWYYVIAKWDPYDNLKIYLNGVLETTTTTTNLRDLRTSTQGWSIARGNSDYSNVKVGEFVVYTQLLTDAQILGNFDGTKSRYGY